MDGNAIIDDGNHQCQIIFQFHGNTLYEPSETLPVTFTSELVEHELIFITPHTQTTTSHNVIEVRLTETSTKTNATRPLSDTIVYIKGDDGTNYEAKTNIEGIGKSTIQLTQPITQYTAYYGTVCSEAVKKTKKKTNPNLTLDYIESIYANGNVSLKSIIKDTNNQPLRNLTFDVTETINDETTIICQGITDEKGIGTADFPLEAGTHNLEFKTAETHLQNPTTTGFTINVLKYEPTIFLTVDKETCYVDENITLTATLNGLPNIVFDKVKFSYRVDGTDTLIGEQEITNNTSQIQTNINTPERYELIAEITNSNIMQDTLSNRVLVNIIPHNYNLEHKEFIDIEPVTVTRIHSEEEAQKLDDDFRNKMTLISGENIPTGEDNTYNAEDAVYEFDTGNVRNFVNGLLYINCIGGKVYVRRNGTLIKSLTAPSGTHSIPFQKRDGITIQLKYGYMDVGGVNVKQNGVMSYMVEEATYNNLIGESAIRLTDYGMISPNKRILLTGTDYEKATYTNQKGVSNYDNLSEGTYTYTTPGDTTSTIEIKDPEYLFYDKCNNPNNLTEYGEIIKIENADTAIMEYDKTMNAYKLTSTGTGFKLFPITALNGLDNLKVTMELYAPIIEYLQDIGISIERGTVDNELVGEHFYPGHPSPLSIGAYFNLYMGSLEWHECKVVDYLKDRTRISWTYIPNSWCLFEMISSGDKTRFNIYAPDKITLIGTALIENEYFYDSSSYVYGIGIGWENGSYGYVRNIKATMATQEELETLQ